MSLYFHQKVEESRLAPGTGRKFVSAERKQGLENGTTSRRAAGKTYASHLEVIELRPEGNWSAAVATGLAEEDSTVAKAAELQTTPAEVADRSAGLHVISEGERYILGRLTLLIVTIVRRSCT